MGGTGKTDKMSLWADCPSCLNSSGTSYHEIPAFTKIVAWRIDDLLFARHRDSTNKCITHELTIQRTNDSMN